ncbi:hypothetical protein LZ30DRAFT_714939 [Colletotrichum cereale]|nr:hypothetical protein LZ30DRAFT_714939 [Colletotrichum cereale]
MRSRHCGCRELDAAEFLSSRLSGHPRQRRQPLCSGGWSRVSDSAPECISACRGHPHRSPDGADERVPRVSGAEYIPVGDGSVRPTTADHGRSGFGKAQARENILLGPMYGEPIRCRPLAGELTEAIRWQTRERATRERQVLRSVFGAAIRVSSILPWYVKCREAATKAT